MLSSQDHGDHIEQYHCERELNLTVEKFCISLCGNFYSEPIKDNFEDFKLEREFIEQNVLGYFLINLDRLSPFTCKHVTQIFHHIINRYAYRTKRPLVEALEYKGQLVLERMMDFLYTNATLSYYVAEMLCNCCRDKVLARKLIDLLRVDEDGNAYPFYQKILLLIETNVNILHLSQLFKFCRALLLTDEQVANYVFTRDLQGVVEIFNRLCMLSNYYVRIRSIELFGQLVQNRYLQTLIHSYTENVANLGMFYNLAKEALKEQRHHEVFRIIEIIRLFLLNPANVKDGKFTEFASSEYVMLNKIIESVQKNRSYTDIVLFSPEYVDVLDALDKLAGKNPEPKGHKGSMDFRFDSDAIWKPGS